MATGIKPKERATTKQFSEHARRYAFYPLSNLNFAGSQFLSPVWNPNMLRARFHLLESFEYKTQVIDETEEMVGSNGIKLGDKTMGTDAQARFLMGNADGTGYMEKGMIILESLTDVDAETAMEVEKLILPSVNDDIVIPNTLMGLKSHLDSLKIDGENPVAQLAQKTLMEVRASVNTAIKFCRQTTAELEKELADGLAGRMGIRSIDPSNAYYFEQIEKPLPSEKATAANAGLAEILMKALQGQAPQANPEAEIEAKADKELIERLQQENAQLTSTIEALTEDQEEEE